MAVNANTKFATNLPLGFGMLITDIEWVVAMLEPVNPPAGAGISTWQVLYQLTEALARLAVAQSDNIDVAVYFDELVTQVVEKTAVGEEVIWWNRMKALERQHLGRPWLSIAQNLNLIGTVTPGETANTNGPEMSAFCRLYFDIVPLTVQQQAYLSQRIQIGGQA